MNNSKGIKNIPDLCFKHELNHVVISPGSRNAPLILSFVNYPNIKCYSIPDERSAGYFALGLSIYLNKPVGVVCTSGTAVLNLSPSIAEAYYQNIPLVIFTADRPPEWLDQEDGQTINQSNVYNNFIKKFFSYPVNIVDDEDLWYANRIISTAIEEAKLFPRGPVHINIPLKEPLYGNLYINKNTIIEKTIKIEIPDIKINENYIEYLKKELNSFKKIMIVSGFSNENQILNQQLIKINQKKQAIVVAENISNLKFSGFISTPESLFTLLDIIPNKFYPDLLITINNSVVSKKMKQFFRNQKNIEHWRINSSLLFSDTYKHLHKEIRILPEIFFELFSNNFLSDTVTNEYFEKITFINNIIQNFNTKFFNEIEFSDIKSIYFILKNLPNNSTVFFSNSTPIRYSQLISARTDLSYFCNRGTSGIDGCISTALGYSVLSENNTFIITGDISFVYDSNALWNKFKKPKIIIINNEGGNIFRLIQKYDDYYNVKDYFETYVNVNFNELAKAFGIKNYFFCDNFELLKSSFYDFLKTDGCAIFEIKTSPDINYKVYNEYFKKLIEYGKNYLDNNKKL